VKAINNICILTNLNGAWLGGCSHLIVIQHACCWRRRNNVCGILNQQIIGKPISEDEERSSIFITNCSLRQTKNGRRQRIYSSSSLLRRSTFTCTRRRRSTGQTTKSIKERLVVQGGLRWSGRVPSRGLVSELRIGSKNEKKWRRDCL
jgi:hypothetical protein